MKKVICLLILFFIYLLNINAQSLRDVANANEITWYGIDFSHARFQNFNNKFATESLRDSLINYWSMGSLNSDGKDFIQAKLKKQKLDVDLTEVNKRNSQINFSDIYTNLTNDIDADTVRKIVGQYPIKGTGYGVLIIIEAFEYKDGRIFSWIAFIDNSNGNIISCRRYISIAVAAKLYGPKALWMNGIKALISEGGKTLKGYK